MNPLLSKPTLPTLVRLSLPNMLAMLAAALVAIAETAYVGLLGLPELAGIALVFPMVMLQQMMSSGAMGGGVSSAISRALGAGNTLRADAIAGHAVLIGLVAGGIVTAAFLSCGPALYRLLGGHGAALEQALAYSNVVFLGSVSVWLTNTLASVLRGTGNMRIPSLVLLVVAGVQVVAGAALGLGLGPLPRLGMVGIGLAQVVAYTLGALCLALHLVSGRERVRPRWAGGLQRDILRDILKVGLVACVSPAQSVLTVVVTTGFIASFGTEVLAGYGIGARLEFLLVPITFAIGVASVPMVGLAIGAGDISRARRVAWTAGVLAGGLVGILGIAVAIEPSIWSRLFTDNPAVVAVARSYLTSAGPAYAFLGLGLALYFASMGSGGILGPVLAQTVRLGVVTLGGWWLSASGATASSFFVLVGVSLIAYGAAVVLAVWLAEWKPVVRSMR